MSGGILEDFGGFWGQASSILEYRIFVRLNPRNVRPHPLEVLANPKNVRMNP